jgi:hypothetical protein
VNTLNEIGKLIGEIRTDNLELPWGEVLIPEIPLGKFGDWEIIEDTPAVARGYFRGVQEVRRNLILKRGDDIWMSLTPMELESMLPHIHGASGKVTVIGGGLGVYLFNVLRKPEVTSVTLIEKDPEIVRLLVEMGVFSWDDGEDKLKIITSDAMNLDPRDPRNFSAVRPDFMFVDIWMNMNDERAVAMTQIIQSKLDAEVVGIWTQELMFITWLSGQGRTPPPTGEDWRDWEKSHGIPVHTYTDAPLWSFRAAEQVIHY